MVRVHVWIRRKEGMSEEDFRHYWLHSHAPIARDGYRHLREYVVDLVTRVPQGQEAPYDGVAEMTWEDREGFKEDMASEAAKRATEDLANFSSASGLLFVDRAAVE